MERCRSTWATGARSRSDPGGSTPLGESSHRFRAHALVSRHSRVALRGAVEELACRAGRAPAGPRCRPGKPTTGAWSRRRRPGRVRWLAAWAQRGRYIHGPRHRAASGCGGSQDGSGDAVRESPDSYIEWAIIGVVAAWLAWRQRGFFAALTRPRRVVALTVFFWRGRQGRTRSRSRQERAAGQETALATQPRLRRERAPGTEPAGRAAVRVLARRAIATTNGRRMG